MITLSVEKHVLGPWICQRIGKFWVPEECSAVGIVDGRRILGVALFDSNTTVAMECHVALAHAHVPLRMLITGAFRYAFMQCGVEKLVGRVNSNNRKALTFDLKLGFEPVAVLPRMYEDGGDMVILMMAREKCRWIPMTYRKVA